VKRLREISAVLTVIVDILSALSEMEGHLREFSGRDR
jgi:hypothetical protein